MEREERKHKKIIESKVPLMRDKQIHTNMGNAPMDSDTAIRVIKRNTGIEDDQTIADSLNRLIQSGHVVTANGIGKNGHKLFVRRNPYKEVKIE